MEPRDHSPQYTFTSATMQRFFSKETHDINRGQESLVVESVGYLVGYNSPWSSTQTQTIDYILNYENKLTEDTWRHSHSGKLLQ